MVQTVEAYRHVSASGEFRELERLRARARHDEANALATAVYKNSLQIARKMKAKGEDIATIVEYTDLTIDDVLRL